MNNLCCKKLELGPIATNAFLMWEKNGCEAVLVDCPPEGGKEIQDLLFHNNLKLKEIWFTHGHWDHIAGAHELLETGVKTYGHRADKLLFEKPELMSGFSFPNIRLVPVPITNWVEHGDTLDLWGRAVTILHCPGHCPGNISFYLNSEKICFVGDVIFSGSIGRTDLPGGDFNQLEKSILENIYTLNDDTELAVGHGPNTSVRKEKSSNPYIRG